MSLGFNPDSIIISIKSSMQASTSLQQICWIIFYSGAKLTNYLPQTTRGNLHRDFPVHEQSEREIYKTVARRSNKDYLIFVLKEKVIQTLEDISTDVTGDWVAVPRPQPGRHVGEGLAPAGAGGGGGGGRGLAGCETEQGGEKEEDRELGHHCLLLVLIYSDTVRV